MMAFDMISIRDKNYEATFRRERNGKIGQIRFFERFADPAGKAEWSPTSILPYEFMKLFITEFTKYIDYKPDPAIVMIEDAG